jgi:hypothetical protein
MDMRDPAARKKTVVGLVHQNTSSPIIFPNFDLNRTSRCGLGRPNVQFQRDVTSTQFSTIGQLWQQRFPATDTGHGEPGCACRSDWNDPVTRESFDD